MFEEVLPSIRANGGYVYTAPKETDEEVLARALNIANQKIQRLTRCAVMLSDTCELLKEERKYLLPRAQYTEQVLQAPNTYTMTEIAKELNMRSGRQLCKILQDQKLIFWQRGHWMPYASISERGYFTTRTEAVSDSYGGIVNAVHLVFTECGRAWAHKLFGKMANQTSCISY